jgi:ADP-L-glycero-D-manno-heptose 6-epimerase
MIIVTGGCGFIGSNLVKALNKHTSESIVVVDSFGNDNKWRNLRSSHLSYIVHPDRLFSYLNACKDGVSTIFHMGGNSSTTDIHAENMIDQNSRLTMDLINWCTQNHKRIVYGSSFATYGNGESGFVDSESTDYLDGLKPMSVHGWSKHLVDREMAYRKMRNIPLPSQWVGLKFFNVFGPNEYHKGSQKSVVLNIYETIRHGNSAKLFKSYNPDYSHGGQMRDFIWIEDAIDLMLWIYDNPNVNGIYNVGTGVARTFNDLAAACFAALNKECKIDYVDMPDELIANYQYNAAASMDKIRAAGYTKPFTSAEEGVSMFIKNYLVKDDIYA